MKDADGSDGWVRIIATACDDIHDGSMVDQSADQWLSKQASKHKSTGLCRFQLLMEVAWF